MRVVIDTSVLVSAHHPTRVRWPRTPAIGHASLQGLIRIACVIEGFEAVTACRDPNDDKFLSVAVGGNASHIISGDQDLLSLHPFRDIAIITPQGFLAIETKPAS